MQTAAAAGIAARPLLSGARDAAHSITDSITGSSHTEEEKKNSKSFKEIFSNPCANLPLIFFFIGGVFGLASLALYFLHIHALDLPTSIVLSAVGIWATYEIRLIVKFRVQLQHLRRVEKTLKSTTQDLEDELKQLDENNDNLKKEVEQIDAQVDRIQSNNNELTATVNELEQSIDEFEAKNQSLKETIANLDAQNEGLQSKCVELRQTGDALREELNQLQQFKENLAQHADSESADLKEIMSQVNDITSKLEQTIQDQESALLHQIAASIEFVDGDEMMTKEEYELFVQRLPQKFKSRMEEKNMTFKTFKGDDDFVDYEEVQKIVDFLMNDSD